LKLKLEENQNNMENTIGVFDNNYIERGMAIVGGVDKEN
jgi:hypothetical protein